MRKGAKQTNENTESPEPGRRGGRKHGRREEKKWQFGCTHIPLQDSSTTMSLDDSCGWTHEMRRRIYWPSSPTCWSHQPQSKKPECAELSCSMPMHICLHDPPLRLGIWRWVHLVGPSPISKPHHPSHQWPINWPVGGETLWSTLALNGHSSAPLLLDQILDCERGSSATSHEVQCNKMREGVTPRLSLQHEL
jgi:hypothetical protein